MTSAKPGCCNVVRLLADYLERQLPPALRAEFEHHLQQCPRCVAQLRTYESTVSLLRSLREEELPPELRLTVKSFIDAKCQNN
jgi:anti-sigma factor RsiW